MMSRLSILLSLGLLLSLAGRSWVAAEAPMGADAPVGTIKIDFADAGVMKDFKPVKRYLVQNAPGFGGQPGFLSSANTGTEGEQLYYTARNFNIGDQSVKLGLCFQAAPETAGGVSRIMLCLAESTKVNLISEPKKLGIRLFRLESPKDPARPWTFQLTNGFSTRDMGEPFALSTEDWYRVEVEFAPTGDGKNLTFKASLQQYDKAGKEKGALLRTGEGKTLLSVTQYKITQMVVGALGQNNAGGATAFDELLIDAQSGKAQKTQAAAENPVADVVFPAASIDPAVQAPQRTLFGSVGHAIHNANFYPDKKDTYWEPVNVLGPMLDARLGWVREGMYQPWFANRERKNVDLHRKLFEGYLDLYQRHGMKVVLCLMAVPPKDQWVKYNSDFFDYAAELVRKYPCIRVVEMHNEPNLSFFWKGTPEDYVAVYGDAAARVKKARPEVQVAIGSVSSLSWEPGLQWFDKVIAAGGLNFADAVAVHPYNRSLPPEVDPHSTLTPSRPGNQFEESVQAWWRAISAKIPPGKTIKVYFTELGYSSLGQGVAGTSGEKQQADYLSRLMLTYFQLRLSGIPLEAVFWYDFKDDGTKTDNGEHHFGLIQSDMSRIKDSYNAYRQVASYFEDAEGFKADPLRVRSSNLPDSLKFYVWRRISDNALVIPFWKLSEPDIGREEFPTELTLELPKGFEIKTVDLYDINALASRPVGFREDHGSLAVPVLAGPRAKWLVVH